MVAVNDDTVVGYYTNAKGFILNEKIQYGFTGQKKCKNLRKSC